MKKDAIVLINSDSFKLYSFVYLWYNHLFSILNDEAEIMGANQALS